MPITPIVCPARKRPKFEGQEVDACPGPYLKALLQKRPTGHHVPFCRLMLAHCLLSYAEDESGCAQDIGADKKEHMALAKEGFGPACYAVGNMHFDREEVLL
jgi:hypothetical protein